jgi:hypothetical protein
MIGWRKKKTKLCGLQTFHYYLVIFTNKREEDTIDTSLIISVAKLMQQRGLRG